MTISRINANQSTTEKIRLLGEMIMELSGKIDQAKFNKNEIDLIYTYLGLSGRNLHRFYIRDVLLGNTSGTYTGWSHVKAEAGYSIWKYSPTNYLYNANNQMYLDNILLENRGQASSESASAFDKVYRYNGSTYDDDTTEAATETGTEFELMADTSDYLYVGLSTTFGGIKFEFESQGSGYTNYLEYWNGSAWTTLSESGNSLVDDTNNFTSDGSITWTIPGSWATTSVNSQTKYWIRMYTTATPTTSAYAYYVIPANSVPGMLALSADDIIAGNWAWCTYGSAVYVTLRNAGTSSYEGDYYITSSSSANNLLNFFVYNHVISANHADSSYT